MTDVTPQRESASDAAVPAGAYSGWLRRMHRVLQVRDESADVRCGSCTDSRPPQEIARAVLAAERGIEKKLT